MKTTKLVAGILMIVLSVFILFQSTVAGLGNALSGNGETGGSGGMITAIIYLTTGIVYIATKSNKKMTADIINMILLLIAWLSAISNAGSYSDLTVWGWLAFIIGIGFFVWHIFANRKTKSTQELQ
ncbi:hypothetical protein [Tetragenococcus solitarius]|uniref:Lipoprotein n=1 Tax=Tetragenococcus solitarius TaxID=71453 RepID=A0ABN3Y631_9ENTE|nr:hypothetical protein [Tetragenococcus solitarius]